MTFLHRISRALRLRDDPPNSAEATTEEAEHGHNPYLGMAQSQVRGQFPPEEFAADEDGESE